MNYTAYFIFGRKYLWLSKISSIKTWTTRTIGRVVTGKHRTGLGSAIFREGVKAAKQHFGVSRIKIMSQLQAKGFYEKLGFVATSEPFMEEGLLHLYMILVL